MSKARKPGQGHAVQTFRAGCGREWEVRTSEPDLAYTEQAFAECPTCPHRVEPDSVGGGDSQPFCTLRPVTAPNPFAGLLGLDLPDG